MGLNQPSNFETCMRNILDGFNLKGGRQCDKLSWPRPRCRPYCTWTKTCLFTEPTLGICHGSYDTLPVFRLFLQISLVKYPSRTCQKRVKHWSECSNGRMPMAREMTTVSNRSLQRQCRLFCPAPNSPSLIPRGFNSPRDFFAWFRRDNPATVCISQCDQFEPALCIARAGLAHDLQLV
jgi:hypothetical protein